MAYLSHGATIIVIVVDQHQEDSSASSKSAQTSQTYGTCLFTHAASMLISALVSPFLWTNVLAMQNAQPESMHGVLVVCGVKIDQMWCWTLPHPPKSQGQAQSTLDASTQIYNSFDVACIKCEHSHLQQKVPFAHCVVLPRLASSVDWVLGQIHTGRGRTTRANGTCCCE